MAEFVLRAEAERDMDRIYVYGFHRFGETQADKYFNGLFDQFERIAKNPKLFPRVDHIRAGYRRSVFQKESIYFLRTDGVVEIIRILRFQDIDFNLM